MDFRAALETILAGGELSTGNAGTLMRALISGEATDAQIAGILVALEAKGCTGGELAAFASVLRDHASLVDPAPGGLVDTCGTGGGAPSFNLSTAAAIMASAAGARVAKHGNRAVTSTCGSADVLESLGVRLTCEPERVGRLLETLGLAFLFAPAFHPALKNIGKVRKELGVRTVFNQLGPLANPAGAKRQIVGVYAQRLQRPMAEALLLLGCERGLVVRGLDGLDEISPRTRTDVFQVAENTHSEGELSPSDFGIEPVDDEALAPGGTVEENASILVEAISDPDSVRFRAALPNAAAAIWLAGVAPSWMEAAKRVTDAVASGMAMRRLQELVEATQAA